MPAVHKRGRHGYGVAPCAAASEPRPSTARSRTHARTRAREDDRADRRAGDRGARRRARRPRPADDRGRCARLVRREATRAGRDPRRGGRARRARRRGRGAAARRRADRLRRRRRRRLDRLRRRERTRPDVLGPPARSSLVAGAEHPSVRSRRRPRGRPAAGARGRARARPRAPRTCRRRLGRRPHALRRSAGSRPPAPPARSPAAAGRADRLPAAALADLAVEAPVGPEVIAGSTPIEAGTAQKVVLNTLSTARVRRGRTLGDLMTSMRVADDKLRDRAGAPLPAAARCGEDAARRRSAGAGDELPVGVVIARPRLGPRRRPSRPRGRRWRAAARLAAIARKWLKLVLTTC